MAVVEWWDYKEWPRIEALPSASKVRLGIVVLSNGMGHWSQYWSTELDDWFRNCPEAIPAKPTHFAVLGWPPAK